MDPCQTPTNLSNITFQFDKVSTPINKTDCKEISEEKLAVNCKTERCFTPLISEISSPGFSPIEMQESFAGGDAQGKKEHFNFPIPIPMASTKPFKKISPTPRNQANNSQKQQQQQLLQQQKSIDILTNGNENLTFDLDLSSSSKIESSLDISSRSESSKCSNSMLNHTMNVTLLLKELGLGEYSEKFAKEGIDLEKFLKLKLNELKSLGLKSDEDCKAIIDMLGELNSSQILKV